jgi:ribosome-associated protein
VGTSTTQETDLADPTAQPEAARSAPDPDDPTLAWAIEAARAADAKQGADPVILQVGEVLALCGWFVVTSGANDRQVKAIAEEVERKVHEIGGPKPIRVEGLNDLRWVLMDFGDLVVHVFSDEARDFYELERLWSDVPHVDWAGERR